MSDKWKERELEAHTFKIRLEQKLAKTKTTKTQFWEKYIRYQCTGISYSYLLGMLSGYGTLREDVKEIILNYPNFNTDESVDFLEKVDELILSGALKNYSRKDDLICIYLPDALKLAGIGKTILKTLRNHPRFIEHGRAIAVPDSKTIRVTVFSCLKYNTLKQAYDKALDNDILFDNLTETQFMKKDIEFDIPILAALSIRWIIKGDETT
jgi:hypothetical protein